MGYALQGTKFESFEALVQWVYDRYKISWEGGDWENISEADKQKAAKEIDGIINELEKESAEATTAAPGEGADTCNECGREVSEDEKEISGFTGRSPVCMDCFDWGSDPGTESRKFARVFKPEINKNKIELDFHGDLGIKGKKEPLFVWDKPFEKQAPGIAKALKIPVDEVINRWETAEDSQQDVWGSKKYSKKAGGYPFF
jgi:hypothetical protein